MRPSAISTPSSTRSRPRPEEEVLPNGDILSREPIGVCGLITPWNWPVNQIALKVLPALATGATCILKPSEHTPLSAQIYAEMVHEAGYPAGVFNLVQGDGPTVGSAMSRHPGIDMMSFTGSARGGKAVSHDATDTIKRVTLELGGKSPNLVFADADLPKRVEEGVRACFDNCGQSCDAPTRMLVERSCYDEVLDWPRRRPPHRRSAIRARRAITSARFSTRSSTTACRR